MMVSTLIWGLFAALTVGAALAVALSKNVVHCGYGLLFSLLGVCAMYAFLGADYLAATQVIVYVGGILVLILFGVMMTHRVNATDLRSELVQPIAALIAAGAMLVLSVGMILDQIWPEKAVIEAAAPTTHAFGVSFLTDYLFPFEFASVLLLVALIGAAMFTREQKSGENKGAGNA
jgi:NADH-quinone oxidoreductase subunit J